MNVRKSFVACSAVLLALYLLTAGANGQQQSLKAQLIGTWTLVSFEQTNVDGSKSQPYGADPKGIAFFDAGSHFILSVMRSDRANYAVASYGQIGQATAEEYRATVLGTLTYFGTYSVGEPDNVITFQVAASSFPNYNGTEQTRLFAIAGDEFRLTFRPPPGGSVDVVWKRAKRNFWLAASSR